MVNLSPRLAAVAAFVPPGTVIADIGTDHAYLPVALINRGVCTKAIAGDINPGPIQSALEHIRAFNLSGKIQVRSGDGLKILRPGEVDGAVIAGMGGGTMVDILQDSPEVVRQLNFLVLQPMNDAPYLRKWLAGNGWQIVDEELVPEKERLYEVLFAKPGVELASGIRLDVGPRLVAKRHPLLEVLLTRQIDDLENILKSLKKSRSPEARDKIKDMTDKIEELKQVISWLKSVKL